MNTYEDYIQDERELTLAFLKERAKVINYSQVITYTDMIDSRDSSFEHHVRKTISNKLLKEAEERITIVKRENLSSGDTILTGELVVMNYEDWQEVLQGVRNVLGIA